MKTINFLREHDYIVWILASFLFLFMFYMTFQNFRDFYVREAVVTSSLSGIILCVGVLINDFIKSRAQNQEEAEAEKPVFYEDNVVEIDTVKIYDIPSVNIRKLNEWEVVKAVEKVIKPITESSRKEKEDLVDSIDEDIMIDTFSKSKTPFDN